MKTYNINDKVWHANRKSTEERATCPECFGKRYLTVILGDGSQVTIDCAGCASGYDPPQGYVTYHKQGVDVRLVTICKVTIYSEYAEYGFDGTESCHHVAKDTDLFSTKKEAEVRARELAKEWNREQLAKIHRKEKNHRDWSWHVHYHRKQIRNAEKTIEYAKAKLDAAKAHTKEKEND